MIFMVRVYRIRTWAAMTVAVALLLCIADLGIGEAGPVRRGGPAFDPGNGKSIRLSLKISGAKKRNRQISFYKSVARQLKFRSTGVRSPPSGR